MSSIREIAMAKAIGGGGSGGRTISYGTSEPDVSAGADGDIYFIGTNGYELFADSEYIVSSTTVLLSAGSTAFYKTKPGKAIAVEAYGVNDYYGPVLISPNLNSVLYTKNDTSSYYSSVTINGIQWWVCGQNYWTRNPATQKNIVAYHNPKYPLPTGTGIADWVAGVLETCHAYFEDKFLVNDVFIKYNGIWHQGSSGLDPNWI